MPWATIPSSSSTTFFEKFKENDLIGNKTEAQKMLMQAVLNRVDCIAETAPRQTK